MAPGEAVLAGWDGRNIPGQGVHGCHQHEAGQENPAATRHVVTVTVFHGLAEVSSSSRRFSSSSKNKTPLCEGTSQGRGRPPPPDQRRSPVFAARERAARHRRTAFSRSPAPNKFWCSPQPRNVSRGSSRRAVWPTCFSVTRAPNEQNIVPPAAISMARRAASGCPCTSANPAHRRRARKRDRVCGRKAALRADGAPHQCAVHRVDGQFARRGCFCRIFGGNKQRVQPGFPARPVAMGSTPVTLRTWPSSDSSPRKSAQQERSQLSAGAQNCQKDRKVVYPHRSFDVRRAD